MKKFFSTTTFAIFLAFFTTNLFAQYEPPRHEASAAIGFITHSDIIEIASDVIVTGLGTATLQFDEDDQAGIAYNFQYNRRFTKHFGVGGVFTYQRITNGVYPGWIEKRRGEPNTKIGEMKSHYISLMPIAKLFWFDTKYVGMYTKLGAGLTILDRDFESYYHKYSDARTENEKSCFLALQVSPIGIEIGKDFRFFLEVGYGTEGLLNLGLEMNL